MQRKLALDEIDESSSESSSSSQTFSSQRLSLVSSKSLGSAHGEPIFIGGIEVPAEDRA